MSTQPTADAAPDRTPLSEALAVEVDGATARLAVHEGFDVFGVPHGGYLLALVAQGVLAVTDAPDLFSITGHFVRKAARGPLEVEVVAAGSSRRFASHHAVARQDGEVVLTALALVGDRSQLEGPAWSDVPGWAPDEAGLTAPTGAGDAPPGPRISEQFAQRFDTTTVAFAAGGDGEPAVLRSVVSPDRVDQLAAVVACDITPPAVWNALGMQGWVPTLELTAHVRGRPADGPLTVVAETHHVSEGFLEEDAVVRDVDGRVVVQSRQLARWTGA